VRAAPFRSPNFVRLGVVLSVTLPFRAECHPFVCFTAFVQDGSAATYVDQMPGKHLAWIHTPDPEEVRLAVHAIPITVTGDGLVFAGGRCVGNSAGTLSKCDLRDYSGHGASALARNLFPKYRFSAANAREGSDIAVEFEFFPSVPQDEPGVNNGPPLVENGRLPVDCQWVGIIQGKR